MPIVIQHQMNAALVGGVAHGAGRGEYDKWVYQEDSAREAEKTQAFLSAFSAAGSLGMQGAQLMQNAKGMKMQQQMQTERINAQKIRAAQSAGAELDWYNNSQDHINAAIDFYNPVNAIEGDPGINNYYRKNRERLKAVGPGHAAWPQVKGMVKQYNDQELRRLNYQGSNSSSSGMRHAAGMRQMDFRTNPEFQQLISDYHQKIDGVKAHLSPNDYLDPKNPLSRGTWKMNREQGHMVNIPVEDARKQAAEIKKIYQAKARLLRKRHTDPLGQMQMQVTPHPSDPSKQVRFDPRTGQSKVEDRVIPNQYFNEVRDKYFDLRVKELQSHHKSTSTKYSDDWKTFVDRKDAAVKQAREDYKLRVESINARAFTEEEGWAQEQTGFAASMRDDHISNARRNFRKDVTAAHFGLEWDPVTGERWGPVFSGTPTNKFFDRITNEAERGAPAGGMSPEERANPANWVIPPSEPSLSSEFTRKRIWENMRRESERSRDPSTNPITDVYNHFKGFTPRNTAIDPASNPGLTEALRKSSNPLSRRAAREAEGVPVRTESQMPANQSRSERYLTETKTHQVGPYGQWKEEQTYRGEDEIGRWMEDNQASAKMPGKGEPVTLQTADQREREREMGEPGRRAAGVLMDSEGEPVAEKGKTWGGDTGDLKRSGPAITQTLQNQIDLVEENTEIQTHYPDIAGKAVNILTAAMGNPSKGFKTDSGWKPDFGKWTTEEKNAFRAVLWSLVRTNRKRIPREYWDISLPKEYDTGWDERRRR